MGFDIKRLLADNEGANYTLHAQHVNPVFAKVLRTIGFDRCYVRAQGPYLWDDAGTRYLDMLGGYGVFNVGRNHPFIKDALCSYLAEDYPSLVQMEAPLLSGLLAAALKKRMPYARLEKVYFTNSGTESVETAIKFARCATGRSPIVFAKKGFHGLTNGSLSVNGDQVFRTGFGELLPDCQAVAFGDLNALEAALRSRPCAAFMIEPIQGKGVNIPPVGYLREASELCARFGTLVVADEVQCGMGRTGRFLASEHESGFEPDIVLLSKALSGGYVPVGAVLTSSAVHERVFNSMDRAVVHSSTFGQNALAMIAGLATLDLMDRLDLMQQAAQMGNYLGLALQAMQPRFEFLREVRWRGLMMGIEFGEPRSLGLRGAWRIAHGVDQSLFPQAITIPLLDEHKLLTQVAGHHIDVIKLLPPLVITKEDCDWFLDGFEQVMVKLHRFPGPLWEALSKMGKNTLRGHNRVAIGAGRH